MLKVVDVSKKIGGKTLFSRLSFEVLPGDRVALVGPSGAGKSTLLRCLAGLESYRGRISFDGRKTLVFQDFNLFPHLTVWENITYVPLVVLGNAVLETEKNAMQLLQRFALEEYRLKYPAELSGGQQQRVAIIRAVMAKVDLLIMDEPTSSLDNATTALIAEFLLEQNTMLFFSAHDELFVQTVATRVFEFTSDGALVEIEKSLYGRQLVEIN
jgi:ABC-type polar amino acid transport system ATPase subunit